MLKAQWTRDAVKLQSRSSGKQNQLINRILATTSSHSITVVCRRCDIADADRDARLSVESCADQAAAFLHCS